jgi:hypothetical protein
MALGRAAVGVAPSATLDGGAGPAFLRDDLANDGYSVTPSENYTYALIAARQQSILFPVDMPASTAATVGAWASSESILPGIEDMIGYPSGAAAGYADHVGWCFFTERPSTAALRGIMASVLEPRGAGPLLVPSGVELWVPPPSVIDATWTDNLDGTFASSGGVGFFRNSPILTTGKTYFASTTIDSRISGGIYIAYDGSGTNRTIRSSPGFHGHVFEADFNIAAVYSSNFLGTVSGVSFQEMVALS